MLRGRRRLLAGLGVAVMAAVAVPLAWADVAQTPVKVQPNPIRETSPAASPSWFAWARSSKAHPRTFNVYGQAMGGGGLPMGPAVQVNPPGTQAFPGGIVGNRLVYQLISGSSSNIAYFNLATHHRSSPPAGVNTSSWEYTPTATDTWLLFGRFTATDSKVLLVNLSTHAVRTLASVPLNRQGTAFAGPGQVNGNFATWYQCTPGTHCRVFLYDITARTTTPIARPAGAYDSSPAVTSTGTLYFDRATNACGGSPELVQLPLAGSPTVLHHYTNGYDIGFLQTYNDGSNDHVFYQRIQCSKDLEDIFEVTAP